MQELVETQGISALRDYLSKIEDKIKKNTANKSLKELYDDYQFNRMNNLVNSVISKGIIHPKLERLKELLKEQLKENSNSRILVFCHFRYSLPLFQIFIFLLRLSVDYSKKLFHENIMY